MFNFTTTTTPSSTLNLLNSSLFYPQGISVSSNSNGLVGNINIPPTGDHHSSGGSNSHSHNDDDPGGGGGGAGAADESDIINISESEWNTIKPYIDEEELRGLEPKARLHIVASALACNLEQPQQQQGGLTGSLDNSDVISNGDSMGSSSSGLLRDGFIGGKKAFTNMYFISPLASSNSHVLLLPK